MAAGLIEQAKVQMGFIDGFGHYRETLKRMADELAATAVAEKVKISNDIEQKWGREE